MLNKCVGRTAAAAGLLRPVSLAPQRGRALHSGLSLALARRHALYAGVQLQRGIHLSAPAASMHALWPNQGPSSLLFIISWCAAERRGVFMAVRGICLRYAIFMLQSEARMEH